MPEPSGGRITRSRSRSRPARRGARKAASNTRSGQRCLSPDHASPLPSDLVNTLSNTESAADPSVINQESKLSEAGKDNLNLVTSKGELVDHPISSEHQKTSPQPAGVSDNMASPHKSGEDPPVEQATDPLMLIMADIQEIKSETKKLGKIEASVDSLFRQFSELTQKTLKLEAAAADSSTRVGVINEEVQGIKQEVQLQAKAISEVQKIKEDFSLASKNNISEMNGLVNEQKSQLEAFQSNSKSLKKDILSEVSQHINQSSKEVYTKAEVDQIIRQALQESGRPQEMYTKAEVDQMIKQVNKDSQYNSLKAKASRN